MILSETVLVTWNSANKKHYVSKGYEFTKCGDTFQAKISDLTKCSNSLVKIQCDFCGKITEVPYTYVNRKKKHSCRSKECNRKLAVYSRFHKDSELIKQEIAQQVTTYKSKFGKHENPKGAEQLKKKKQESYERNYGNEHKKSRRCGSKIISKNQLYLQKLLEAKQSKIANHYFNVTLPDKKIIIKCNTLTNKWVGKQQINNSAKQKTLKKLEDAILEGWKVIELSYYYPKLPDDNLLILLINKSIKHFVSSSDVMVCIDICNDRFYSESFDYKIGELYDFK